MSFYKSAEKLTKNPIGIIGLFLVLIYACLSTVTIFSTLPEWLTSALVVYLIVFPLIVLFVFHNLVTKHYNKLYAPSDFKDDKTYLDALKAGLQKTPDITEVSSKIIEDATSKIKSGLEINNIKKEVEKAVYKSLLLPHGSLTNKVLYFSLESRVSFNFIDRKVLTIFDDEQQGAFTMDSFYEEFLELNTKRIIKITSMQPFNFIVCDNAKDAVKEVYEDVFLKDSGDRLFEGVKFSIKHDK